MKQPKILVTGAAGCIGKPLVTAFMKQGADLIGLDRLPPGKDSPPETRWETADITDTNRMNEIIDRHRPDVIVHAAGIAHQKMGGPDLTEYNKVNAEATRTLAEAAFRVRPDVHFIFLSTISIYGEKGLPVPCGEETPARPTNDYGRSKAAAEKALMKIAGETGSSGCMDLLRLSPVYDTLHWRLNLERRILLPGRIGYVRFGEGRQRMSILAGSNLSDFILHLTADQDRRGMSVMNVCDREPVRFIDLIRIFRKARVYPLRPVIPIPMAMVHLACAIMGRLLPSRREWFDAGYDKLSEDLVFDNTRMLRTGFEPRHDLHSVFAAKERSAE